MRNYLADITNPALGPTLQGDLTTGGGVGFVQKLIPSLIGLAFVAGAVLFFFMLIIAALQWITSGGDKAAVEAAKGRLTQAIIGIVILFAVYAIVSLIQNFFGINIITIDIGPLMIK